MAAIHWAFNGIISCCLLRVHEVTFFRDDFLSQGQEDDPGPYLFFRHPGSHLEGRTSLVFNRIHHVKVRLTFGTERLCVARLGP